MRALRLHPPGRVGDLRLDQVEPPQPQPGQALVRVHAAAITRDELTWPTDRLPAIPSYELSGVVAEDTDGLAAGQEVFALTPFDRDGVAADYALVPTEVLAPKPRSLRHVQAAAVPMPWLSAWQALIVHGRLQSDERVAVTGARGGVGHLAVQLARSRGATLVEAGEPCDLLFDTAGGEALARSAGQAGRIVTIAAETPGPATSSSSPTASNSSRRPGLSTPASCSPRSIPSSPLPRPARRLCAAPPGASTARWSSGSPTSQRTRRPGSAACTIR
jgi:hypothetical protein